MSYSSEVLADSPLAYWKLDEAAAPAADAAGNGSWIYGAGVTVQKTPLVADGGYAVSGDGTHQIVSSPSMPAGVAGASVTLACWVKIPSANCNGPFIKVGDTQSNGWGVGVGGTNWDNAGHQLILLNEALAWVATGVTLTAGVHHIMVVRNASNSFTCYVDGASVYTTSFTPNTATGRVGIGGYSTRALSSTIDIDNVAIFASALSATRVTAQYASGSGSDSAVLADSPVAFLKLDETTAAGDSGATAADSSGNARTLTHNSGVSFGLPSLLGDGSGHSVSYDGTSQYSSIATATWMNNGYASGEVRINVTSANLTGQPYIASRWSGNDSTDWWLWSIHGGKAEVSIHSAASTTVTATGATTLTTGKHTLGWSFDGTALKVYVDGVLDATTTVSTTTISATSGYALELGRAAASLYGAVSLDEFSFYDHALTATRFSAHHAAAISTGATATTGTLPASAGTSSTGLTIGSSTAALGVAVALAASALTIGVTTGSLPATVTASDSSSTRVSGSTTGALPAGAGLSADATTTLPPGVTTGTLPVGVSLDASATTLFSAAGELALGVGLESTSSTVGVGATTGVLGATVGLAADAATVTAVGPWTFDLSGRTMLALVTSGSADSVPPLSAIPAGIVEHPITRTSRVVPDLRTIAGAVLDPTTGRLTIPDNAYDALPLAAPEQIVGVPHLLIDGVDVTYFRGSRTQVISDEAQEPFGDARLTVEFPQITTLDDTTDPGLSWMRADAAVHYVMQHWDSGGGPTGIVTTLFHGRLVSDDSGNDATSAKKSWDAQGTLWQAASFDHQARPLLEPVDIGSLIPSTLNGVTSRRYPKLPNVTTGIVTRQRGNTTGDKELSYVQALLATAWTNTGGQWTVGKKPGTVCSYQVRLKKTAPVWTITNGQRGVAVALSADSTQGRNVIYGRGQRSDGGVWMNKRFPDAGHTSPAYPFTSPGTVMSIGTTDAMTSTGDGVTTWQKRARALGFHVAVNGIFDADASAVARELQRQYGILVDGVVGPQTWAETFDVGARGADPDSWVRLPLAADPRTQPVLYRANGSVIGPNPAYDPTVTIVSDDIDFGTDVTRDIGTTSAQQIVDRETPPGLSGTIVLTADPREGSRWAIDAGDPITLIGYEGRNPVLHVATRTRNWRDRTVSLQVAETAYDALTLAQLRARDLDARRDVGRRPGKIRQKPTIDPWDCESNAGKIERHALYPGLWTVIRIPMSEYGRLSSIDMQTAAPARFCIFLFANPITSMEMVRYVGANPLALSSPGETNRALLEDRYGWLEGWGRSGDALGYYPGSEGSTPPAALSGRFKDSGIDYWSPTGYIYIAEFADRPTFIEGEMRALDPQA